MSQSENKQQSVGIVGAGLVGCLAALAFAAKGYTVYVFELRPDPRDALQGSSNLRSINLAVSDRGIRALRYVDDSMASRILQYVIPMKGRMIHDITGTKQESQIYGLFGESINSIDRSFLNKVMLDEMSTSDNIKILFNRKLIKLSHLNDEDASPKMSFLHLSSDDNNNIKDYEFDYIIGADGAHSQFRYQLQRFTRMNFQQEYIDMQYLELHIPANPQAKANVENSKFSIDPNHLHIWPRHNFMLIALANQDGSFTSTFFSPWSVIEALQNSTEFIQFFSHNFPDAYKLMGEEHLRYSFDHSPRGSLMQVSTYPYHNSTGKALIIGDAAHSMVPFYGQGMNCGFEDVHVLMKLIDANNGDITSSFKQYSDQRHEDLQTICKLALDNYREMSSHVTSSSYLIKKYIDYALGKWGNGRFFQWIPMYTMISFRGDIRYSDAVKIEKRQSRILHGIQLGAIGTLVLLGVTKAAQYWHKINRN